MLAFPIPVKTFTSQSLGLNLLEQHTRVAMARAVKLYRRGQLLPNRSHALEPLNLFPEPVHFDHLLLNYSFEGFNDKLKFLRGLARLAAQLDGVAGLLGELVGTYLTRCFGDLSQLLLPLVHQLTRKRV